MIGRTRRRSADFARLLLALLAVAAAPLVRPQAEEAAPPPAAAPPTAAEEEIHLVVLHINDVHGRLSPDAKPAGTIVGGAARLATLVAQVRAEAPDRVLLLHAGDILSRGDLLTIADGGDLSIGLLATMGLDAYTPGNGDFYFGLPNLQRLAKLAPFPFLHANARTRVTDAAPPFQATLRKTVAGVHVGVFGLGRLNVEHPSIREMSAEDPLMVGKALALELRPEVDVLLALTHIGVGQDEWLAAQAPQIDVIVGGDSHTQLDSPRRVARSTGKGQVVIAQTGDNGRYLGRLDLYLRPVPGGAMLTRIDGRLLPITASIPEDPGVKATLDAARAQRSQPLAESTVNLEHPAKGPTPMGAYVVEAVRAGVGTPVALLDRGAVNGGLRAGPVTMADVCRIHPWRNRVLRVTCTGAQVREVLRAGVLAAGCELRANAQGQPDVLVGGTPLAADATVAVALGEYLHWNTPALRGLPWTDTGERVDTLLLRHLQRPGTLAAPATPPTVAAPAPAAVP